VPTHGATAKTDEGVRVLTPASSSFKRILRHWVIARRIRFGIRRLCPCARPWLGSERRGPPPLDDLRASRVSVGRPSARLRARRLGAPGRACRSQEALRRQLYAAQWSPLDCPTRIPMSAACASARTAVDRRRRLERTVQTHLATWLELSCDSRQGASGPAHVVNDPGSNGAALQGRSRDGRYSKPN
jgi:hypothetical protein